MGDHPRVCGEKSHFEPHYKISSGSPPRVRGKAFQKVNRHAGFGITPACAGKSNPDYIKKKRMGDHPRVCGEKTKESLKK